MTQWLIQMSWTSSTEGERGHLAFGKVEGWLLRDDRVGERSEGGHQKWTGQFIQVRRRRRLIPILLQAEVGACNVEDGPVVAQSDRILTSGSLSR